MAVEQGEQLQAGGSVWVVDRVVPEGERSETSCRPGDARKVKQAEPDPLVS